MKELYTSFIYVHGPRGDMNITNVQMNVPSFSNILNKLILNNFKQLNTAEGLLRLPGPLVPHPTLLILYIFCFKLFLSLAYIYNMSMYMFIMVDLPCSSWTLRWHHQTLPLELSLLVSWPLEALREVEPLQVTPGLAVPCPCVPVVCCVVHPSALRSLSAWHPTSLPMCRPILFQGILHLTNNLYIAYNFVFIW